MYFRLYGQYISCLSSGKQWILAIMTRPLPEPEEFSEVQCRYLASEEVLTGDFSPDRHVVNIIDILQCRRNCFHAIPDPGKELKLFGIHSGLRECTVHHLSGDGKLADLFKDLRLAVHCKRAVRTFVPLK